MESLVLVASVSGAAFTRTGAAPPTMRYRLNATPSGSVPRSRQLTNTRLRPWDTATSPRFSRSIWRADPAFAGLDVPCGGEAQAHRASARIDEREITYSSVLGGRLRSLALDTVRCCVPLAYERSNDGTRIRKGDDAKRSGFSAERSVSESGSDSLKWENWGQTP